MRVHNPEYQPPVTLETIQLAKTRPLQLNITFLFINLFLIFLFEGLTSTSGYKKSRLTRLPHIITSNVN